MLKSLKAVYFLEKLIYCFVDLLCFCFAYPLNSTSNMSGRSLFVRCFLIAVNLAVVLMAIGLLLLGSRFELFQTDHLQELFGNSINWRTVAVFAILVSFVTGIVALFGLGAAFCYSACLMNVYAYFLVLITIAILFFNGALFYFHGHIAKEVTNVFTTSMQKVSEQLSKMLTYNSTFSNL